MKKSMYVLGALLAVLSVTFVACSKSDSGNSSSLKVRLTDAPIDLDSVFVEILEVRVKMGNDSIADTSSANGWVNLQTNAGIYNLLGLQNGVDTLLASGTIPTGMLKEIRFILGTHNRVVDTLGVNYPLTIPSGAESGLKIKVNKNLNASIETLLIDFDTDLSIKKEATGYKLRPVLKVK
jgi:Domain of unknown function (DUF4382)